MQLYLRTRTDTHGSRTRKHAGAHTFLEGPSCRPMRIYAGSTVRDARGTSNPSSLFVKIHSSGMHASVSMRGAPAPCVVGARRRSTTRDVDNLTMSETTRTSRRIADARVSMGRMTRVRGASVIRCAVIPRPGASVSAGLEIPSYEHVREAYEKVTGGVVRSRCTSSKPLSDMTGMNLHLKHEWEQATGSFKERGARNALLALDAEQRRRGVIAASAGNHALALAYHGRELGIPVTVIMPSIAPLTKITKCKKLGARVILEGDTIADAAAYARANYVDSGEKLKYINGFDDFEIIAGAGTVGIEMLEDVRNADAVVIPVGGGGLIAGVALAIKRLKPSCMVIGVEPERCASMTLALQAGEPVKAPTTATLADGLAVPTVGPRSFETVKDLIDKIVLVSESDIAVAMLRLLENEKLVQEGAGISGLAALLTNKLPELKGKTVVVAMCGGNIDTSTLGYVLERGLVSDGRLVRFSCVVPDRPGGIAGLCNNIAAVGASIKHINHERAWLQEDSHSVLVDVECEVTNAEMGELLYDEISTQYSMKTANFGPANRPRLAGGRVIPANNDPVPTDDITHPVAACDMDEECDVVFEEIEEEAK